MVQALRRAHTARANPESFQPADIQDKALSSDEFRDVAWVQADKTTAYGAGHGADDTRRNHAGWSDFDAQNATPGPIEGKARFVVYRDSSREDMVAKSGKYSLGALRSAVSAGRKDKVLIPGHLSDVAGEDGYLALQIKADPANDGDTITGANCDADLGLAFSELPL